ncbi:MAG: hypothetical protein WCC60_14880 [Ilumatobacteraceae bacterium]
MKFIAAALFAATACFSLSGCPANVVKEGAKAADRTPDANAPANDINATSAQCRSERETLETAIETYTLLNGAPPASEAAMVPDWILGESVFMDIDAAGNVVPAPGSGCT